MLLSAMLLTGYVSVNAAVSDSTNVEIPLSELPPINNGGDDGGHGGHHAPAPHINPPSVVYNLTTQELVFTGEATQATFTYYIKEEDTEVTVDYGTMTLAYGEEDSVSIATLPAGDYTILLQVGAYWYAGDFIIEEE